MVSGSISQLVDDLIVAQKEFGGIPTWRGIDHDPSEMRMVLPLLVNGTQTSAHIEIKAYPSTVPLKFAILLIMEKCVFRVDFASYETHINSFNRPSDLIDSTIKGSHYHSWVDNKRFCTSSSLPDKLLNARVLPPTLRTFDNVLRWVCGELNIAQPPNGLIDLPLRTTLL